MRTAYFTAVLAMAAGAAIAQPVARTGIAAGRADDPCIGCGKCRALVARFDQGLPPATPPRGGYGAREAFSATDVLSYTLDIEVVPAQRTLGGACTMHVRSLVNGLTQFTFMLSGALTVSDVLINNTTHLSATLPAGGSYARVVTLNRPYNAGEEFTLTVTYSGTPVGEGFGSIIITDNSAETLSESYYAGSWWPVKDGDVYQPGDNSDKATIDLSLTAPTAMRSVGNGLLQGITPLSGGRSKYRWVSNYPTAPYLVFFSTRAYNTWTQTYTYPLPAGGTGTMPVEFNIDPASDTPANRGAWGRCLDMLAAYRPYYGEYPFLNEKYGIYQFNFNGGMEHQTNTGQGTFAEYVTAHELGHQWWGDNVTCKTWNDIWLNEGFATYTECLWEEHAPGASGLPAYLAAMQARKPVLYAGSVYRPDISNLYFIFDGTTSYRKGAWVLHQLRHIVGDTAFYQVLQQYRAQYQGSAATTDDFALVASTVSGRDLSRFFRQCVRGVGSAAYAMGTQPVVIDGNNYLRVSLRQTQDALWPGVGTGGETSSFAFPVDLRVDTAAGSGTVKLNSTARAQNFLIPMRGTVPSGSAATGAVMDEFEWVFRDSTVVSEAYVPGPPHVIGIGCAPSGSSAESYVAIYFSSAVATSASAFSIFGASGPVPFVYTYIPTLQAVVLTFDRNLPPQTITVRALSSGIHDGTTGIALDGEYPGIQVIGLQFPSGDGLAGGDLQWNTFFVGCGSADFNNDGDIGTDQDIEAFFRCLAGNCCPTCFPGESDFNGDGDAGTDQDIESFFRVLAGGSC